MRTPAKLWLRLSQALLLCFLSQPAIAEEQSLQAVLTRAYRNGQRRIVIPPGTYRVAPPLQGSHLQFAGMSDVEIDARGVELVFTDQTRGGIEFRDCHNLTFVGATIRYQVPPFTQGVVTAVAADGLSYVVQLDHGYPSDLDNPAHFPAHPIAYLFDRQTRLLKPGTYDLYGARAERIGRGRFRVFWNRPSGPAVHPVSIGDLIAFRGSGRHNITVLNSEGVVLTGVTILNSAEFAIWEYEGEGANRYSVVVKRGPPPPGARNTPLFSTTSDAFHSTNVRHGPVLENCDFEGMADDAIAIQGTFSFVFEAEGSRLILNHNTFRPGDPLRLFHPDLSPAGEAIVKSIRSRDEYHNTRRSRRTTLADPTTGPYTEVTLDRSLDADFDYLASNPAASGSGYLILHNRIRNHRARGMLLKADNGLVEGNMIQGSSMGGIVLTPELWWNEASYSRNIRILDNTIRRVAYAPRQLGAVVIAALEDRPISGCGHENIVVEGNRFEDNNGVNLLITSACGVEVHRNQFVRPGYGSVQSAGESWGEDPSVVVFVSQANDIRFSENEFVSKGPFARTNIARVLQGPR
jgi:hypothetical protein